MLRVALWDREEESPRREDSCGGGCSRALVRHTAVAGFTVRRHPPSRRWAMAGWFHEPSQEFPPWFWELTSAEDAALSAEEGQVATD